MTIEILRAPDAPIEPLLERTVAVIGYGNQGRAHALNLRDSGITTIVGNRVETKNAATARDDGFDVLPIGEAAARGDLLVLALPDVPLPSIYDESIAPHVHPGATLGLLHGFALRFGGLTIPKTDGLVMVAPKGPGRTLRERFQQGQGIPCIFALGQESSNQDARTLGLAWANGIGGARAGIIVATIAAETETDLFGEQAVLCGGMTALILEAFETLVQAGYPQELAYIECCHEAKQVADLVYERGLAGMAEAISDTAEFGMHEARERLTEDDLRSTMADALQSIRDGSFARRMIDDMESGGTWFEKCRQTLRQHPIEVAGATVRRLMPWLQDDDRASSVNPDSPATR